LLILTLKGKVFGRESIKNPAGSRRIPQYQRPLNEKGGKIKEEEPVALIPLGLNIAQNFPAVKHFTFSLLLV
jgi:hypothetical protein